MTATKPAPDRAPSPLDDKDIAHLVCCCDENLAVCGLDMTNVPVAKDDAIPCPLCFDGIPERAVCPRCRRDCFDCDWDPGW